MAPAFGLTLRLARRDRLLLAVWVALSAAVGAIWLTTQGWSTLMLVPRPGWLVPLVALVVGLPVAWGVWQRAARAVVTLDWQGGIWRLAGSGEPAQFQSGRVEPMIDLGSWMLLRFRSSESGLVRWFVADAAQAGSHWHALRAALYRPTPVGVSRA